MGNGDDDAAFGGAVEFGEDKPIDLGDFAEGFGLGEGILAHGGVEDEEGRG